MALFVIGMHRSGTSALTRALNLCGLSLGEEAELMPANDANPRGYWERSDVTRVNDQLLESMGSAWDDPLPWLEAGPEIYAAVSMRPNWIGLHHQLRGVAARITGETIVKDPRLSLTLPIWQHYIKDLSVVCLHRQPGEVARSLRRRDGMPVSLGLALWEVYTRQAVQNAAPFATAHIDFHALLNHPRQALSQVAEALPDLDWATTDGAVDSIGSPMAYDNDRCVERLPQAIAALSERIGDDPYQVSGDISPWSKGTLQTNHFARQRQFNFFSGNLRGTESASKELRDLTRKALRLEVDLANARAERDIAATKAGRDGDRAVRDADQRRAVAVAEAKRERDVAVAEAKRERDKAIMDVRRQCDALVAQVNRERDQVTTDVRRQCDALAVQVGKERDIEKAKLGRKIDETEHAPIAYANTMVLLP